MNDIIQTITVYAIPVIFAITLHEAAHGYVAKHFGDVHAVRQVAVAKRPKLSPKVTGAIVEFGVERAVETACSNDNAEFTDRTLDKAVERFEKSENVLAAIAFRAALPLSVTERLVNLVGDQVREHLINHHALSPETALARPSPPAG